MAGEEPPYLTVGTDVSAKYKGAFCEAKIKKVTRSVKCKLTFKNNVGTAIVTDDQIRGTLRVGAHVEARHPEKNQFLEAVVNKLNDYSQYTVVFDDGDETTLRRTSLCLKSGRHFAESETLDQLPLTHPEHFGNPVMNSKGRRSRTTTRSPAVDESSDDEQASKKKEVKAKPTDPDIGRVIYVEQTEKKKTTKDSWFPALIISSKCQDTHRVKKQEEFLVRSFRDGKYHVVNKKDVKDFVRDQIAKVENNSLKTAIEKVLTYLDKDELPNHWDRDVLFGLEDSGNEESDQATESDTSDDEPSEEKDRFVAQLYKFMDDRGTPINKAPTVCNRDLNLYKLFKVVQKSGGYNRVTNQMQWKTVYAKMGFPPGNSSSSHQIKQAYKKYLHSFEEFYRKLGISMGSNTRSGRVRYRSGRYLLMARDQHYKGTRRRNSKSDVKTTSNDSEKNKSRDEDNENTVSDSEEAKSEKREKDVEDNSDGKKPENIKVKVEKDDESDKESKEEGDDSENEPSKPTKEEPKTKLKSKNSKDDETTQPKRRGRKKAEKVQNADDDDSSNNNDEEEDEEDGRDTLDIAIGDRVKVKYGRGRQQKIYEAKVLKLGEEENDKEYFVHYTGWNMRYDEWVERHRIVKNLSQKSTGRRPRSTTPAKSPKTPVAKKGRPQGSATAKKETAAERKSSTPTTSTPRARLTRGEKSINDSLVVDQKRTTRHSSLQRDASDESDSDSAENQQKRTKRSLTKKNSQVEDNETPAANKYEEDDSEDGNEVVTKKVNVKSENTKKESMGTSKDKFEKSADEEDSKKQAKKLKEKPKIEDGSDLLEESPKSTRRPRGRPPRQGGEEKKTSLSNFDKKPLFKNESEARDDNDTAEDETETISLDSATESNNVKEEKIDSVTVENVKSEEDDAVNRDDEKEESSDADATISASEPDTESNKVDEIVKLEETPTLSESIKEVASTDETISNQNDRPSADTGSDGNLSSLDEPESELLCDEKMMEDESNSENIAPAVIPDNTVASEENNIKTVTEDVVDTVAEIPDAASTEELEKSKSVICLADLEQDSAAVLETTKVVAIDKPVETPDSVSQNVCEYVSKKELLSNHFNQTVSSDNPAIEELKTSKENEGDVYEYAEECFEDELNSKKIDNKVCAIEAVEADQLIETSVVEAACAVTIKEVAKDIEVESKADDVPIQTSVIVTPPIDTISVTESAVEVKPEKCDIKLESSPGPSLIHSSSRSIKKEKKKKAHKAEKRKFVEGDTSEDGSSADEPKSKRRKNRDDELSVKKESKGKDTKQKKSREKRNKSKGDRDELKFLKKSGTEKSRKKECKKKKESPEKNRKERDDDLKLIIDSDDFSSVSSDSCQRKEKKKSRKHQHRCDKNRDESDKKRLKKYKTLHEDENTSDENIRGKKSRKEEKSKSKKKRDKGKAKDFHVSSEDSNSSKMSGSLSKCKEKVVEKSTKLEEGDCEIPKYLMCEEKVPASPVGVGEVPEGNACVEDRPESVDSAKCKENVRLKTNDGASSSGSLSPHRRQLKLEVIVADSSAVIDNTPPTTPESSGTATLDHLHDHSSPSSVSLNDADSNHPTTGKSSQGSSPQNYSDETERSRDLLIDESNNRMELMTCSDEGDREETKAIAMFGSGPVKRSLVTEHEDQISTKKKKKRHRKHLSINEPSKHNTSLDGSSNKHSSKHVKGADNDEVPSSTTDASVSGLLLSRLNPAVGVTDTSFLPHPTRPSRYNFYVELDNYADGEQRIAIIQEKLNDIRKTYMALKAKVASIDRRRKKLKKKEKEAASSSTSVASTIVECN